MSNAITECSDGFGLLQQYFADLSTYYLSGGAPPSATSFSDSLVYPEMLTFTTGNAERAADYSIGAGVEAVSHFAGVAREVSVVVTRKSQIYLDAMAEATNEADFHDQNASFFSGIMRGAATNGSQC